MQSDANQCNTLNCSGTGCKLMKLLEVYYAPNGVAVHL